MSRATATVTSGLAFTAAGRRDFLGRPVENEGAWARLVEGDDQCAPVWVARGSCLFSSYVGAELWEIEVTTGSAMYRVVRRVDAWDAPAMVAFAAECARRAAEIAATTPSRVADQEAMLAQDAAEQAAILAGGYPHPQTCFRCRHHLGHKGSSADELADAATAALLALRGAAGEAAKSDRVVAIVAEVERQSEWLLGRLGIQEVARG